MKVDRSFLAAELRTPRLWMTLATLRPREFLLGQLSHSLIKL